jgi:hypothetical protein
MPCPYFEPKQVATDPQHRGARLPLLDEYDGLCHATGDVLGVPSDVRFRCCNHGYSRGGCDRFPRDESRSGLRYNVVRRTGTALEIVCVEEQQYAPLHWYSIQYFLDSERIEPQLSDTCIRAQVLAFCRSYLKRFSG